MKDSNPGSISNNAYGKVASLPHKRALHSNIKKGDILFADTIGKINLREVRNDRHVLIAIDNATT